MYLQGKIKSAKQEQGAGTPCPLHTEKAPPYAAVIPRDARLLYFLFSSLYRVQGRRQPVSHVGAGYGLEHNSVPALF